MAYIRCDVASNGPYRYQQSGEFFPRCDVSPVGGWVATDCRPNGNVFVKTSAGVTMELGPRHPDNPACPRFQVDGLFHVYMVAVTTNKVTGAPIVFGRHLTFDPHGQFIEERQPFDASLAGSQGILDVTSEGEILWWDAYNWRVIDDLVLRNWRERGDFIVGTLQENWLGVSVYEKSTGHWFRAWPYDTQLLPGIAVDGTVAAQGEGGGFIERADWITRRFDPHEVVITPQPPTIAAQPESVTVNAGQTATFTVEAVGTGPLFYQWFIDGQVATGAEESTFTTPTLTKTVVVYATIENVVGSLSSAFATATVIDDIDPEPEMPAHSVVKVNNELVHVVEGKHHDDSIGIGPVVSVAKVTNGDWLRVNTAGGMDWKPKAQGIGSDEAFIPVPGAYVANRGDKSFIVTKAGPWTQ